MSLRTYDPDGRSLVDLTGSTAADPASSFAPVFAVSTRVIGHFPHGSTTSMTVRAIRVRSCGRAITAPVRRVGNRLSLARRKATAGRPELDPDFKRECNEPLMDTVLWPCIPTRGPLLNDSQPSKARRIATARRLI